MNARFTQIFKDGLWSNNPALVQVLGLCPLLAVSTSFVNGISLGLATGFVLMLSNFIVSIFAPHIPPTVRLPVYVLLIASLVTCVELLIHAQSVELYNRLGIFLPLIVTNCIILGRAEGFASRNRPLPALIDGLANGLGFALILVLIGSIREILGSGKLFADINLLTGIDLGHIQFPHYEGFLLLILPPGGFIVLGFLIALYNLIKQRQEQAAKNKIHAGDKRVRVTG